MRVVIGGDFDPGNENHLVTEAAIRHAADELAVKVVPEWASTVSLECPELVLDAAAGLFLTTGSPYASLDGALRAIRYAREHALPFLGTCGGFQHVVVEGFRHVTGLHGAAHGEYDPGAPSAVVAALACSLRGQTMAVHLRPGSLAAAAYATEKTTERYYCQYGVADRYRDQLSTTGLAVTGRDGEGEPRIVERSDHPFFVATLFVPQASSSPRAPPAGPGLRSRR